MLIAGIVLGAYICIETLLSRTSILGQLYLYVAIFAFLLGIAAPRASVLALIVCTGYIDFFKRLMVIAGYPNDFDVACALATPPLLCAGAVVNLIFGIALGKKVINRSLIISFALASVLLLLTVASTLSAGNLARGLGGVANTGSYAFLLVIIPIYFPSTEDKLKIVRWAYIVFIGVALYMHYHNLYGLADFEIDYLKTNLSLEARILTEEVNVRRCFSTMNGAGIVSTMCALMFFWSFINFTKLRTLAKIRRLIFAGIFASAAYFTFSRTGWFCGIAGLVCYALFQNFRTTIMAYTLGIGTVILLVCFSPFLLDKNIMTEVETSIRQTFNVESDRGAKASTLGSFNGRLNGYKNLMTKPMMWTPFGWKMAGRDIEKYDPLDLGDDTIVWSIIRFGYIPVFGGGCFLLIFLLRVHRFVCNLPKKSDERMLGNLCLATIVGIMVGGLGNGAQFQVFPLNVYLYMCLAFAYSLYIKRNELSATLAPIGNSGRPMPLKEKKTLTEAV